MILLATSTPDDLFGSAPQVQARLLATNSVAFDVVQNTAKIPVLGLINSAAEMITERRVGVLATSATVSSNAYKRHIEALKTLF